MSRVTTRSLERVYLQRAICCTSRRTRTSTPAYGYFHPHRSQLLQPPPAVSRSSYICYRCLHTTGPSNASKPPKSHDRGPPSKEETQTDFSALDVLGSTPPPTTAIDACTADGFALNSNIKVSGSGVLLVGGEAFRWQPWLQEGARDDSTTGKLLNARGQWEVGTSAWGVLELVWPKPDLLIIGTGPNIVPLSKETRKHINEMGIRIEVQDTRNAASQYNLLATERGVEMVAAALIPVGWREGR